MAEIAKAIAGNIPGPTDPQGVNLQGEQLNATK